MSRPPAVFRLERYFAAHEFSARWLLGVSDVESVSMSELLELSDDETRATWRDLRLGYTTSDGLRPLRTEAARLHGVDEDQTLVVCPQEGVHVGINAILDAIGPNSHVICVLPVYQSLSESIAASGLELSYWKLHVDDHEDHGCVFRLDDLRAQLQPNTRALVVNFPHNPSGFVPTDDEWSELLTICRDRGIYIFSDEMYRLTNNDGTSANPSACQLYDRAITLFGVSKSFGLPGLRIGWVCTRDGRLMTRMRERKDYMSMCSSAPSEVLALIALRARQRLLDRSVSILRRNLDRMDVFVAKWPSLFHWKRPRAGSTALLGLSGWILQIGAGGVDGLCEQLRRRSGILATPVAMFGLDGDAIRIGFGRDNFCLVLDEFDQFLRGADPVSSDGK